MGIKDFLITILFRNDFIEREENLFSLLNYLCVNELQNIKILEISSIHKKNHKIGIDTNKSINYNYIIDNDSLLHRTSFINQMIIDASFPYIAVWDVDVIVSINQIINGLILLQNDEADFVYPYDKFFLETTPIIRKFFIEDRNFDILVHNQKKMKEMYAPDPLGGAFIVNREAYIKAGMENEDFYGWGMEDGERFYRWQRLGYRVKRVPGPLYHLSHPRGINSKFHNQDQSLWKRKETLKAKRLAEATGWREDIQFTV